MNRRLGCVVVVLLTIVGCSSGKSTSPPQASSDPAAWAQAVDPARPAKVLPIAPPVDPVNVPARARTGRRMTSVFQTRSDVSCQLDVVYANGTDHQRLAPATSDGDGLVKWTWTPRYEGVATAVVVCSGGQRGEATIRFSA